MGPKVEGEAGCRSHMELQLRPPQQSRLVPGQKQGTLASYRYGSAGDVDRVGLGFVYSDCDELEVGADLVLMAWPWWCTKQLSTHMQPWREESVCLEYRLHMVIYIVTHSTERGEGSGPRVQICG